METYMSAWQKTVHIINLMPDWSIWGMGEDSDDIVLQIGGKETAVLQSSDYLYNRKWMFLAWRVLNWANNEYESGEDWSDGLWTWWADSELWRYAPAEAQRLWLDKILSLAIDAGMVKEEGE